MSVAMKRYVVNTPHYHYCLQCVCLRFGVFDDKDQRFVVILKRKVSPAAAARLSQSHLACSPDLEMSSKTLEMFLNVLDQSWCG